MLTKENVKGLADLLDELIKFKNPLLEAIDGPTLKGVINLLDNQLFEKIPEQFHGEINEVIADILVKDYEEACNDLMQLIAKILNDYVIPKPAEED